MDVARAVDEDLVDGHPHEHLGAGELTQLRIVLKELGLAVHAQAMGRLEVDEEHPDLMVGADVTGGEKHAVAVVDGKDEGSGIDHAHEAGRAALVGAGREAARIDGTQEEHVAGFDEGLLLGGERVAHDGVLDAIGEFNGIETLLQRALLVAVDFAHGSSQFTQWVTTSAR